MIPASEVLTAYVTKLRAIPALVAAVKGSTRIVQHDEQQPLIQAIRSSPFPSVVVAWQGTGVGMRGQIRQIAHRISLYVRADGDPSAIFDLLVDGVPTGGDGQKMLFTTVHSLLFPMEQPMIDRQQLDFGDGEILDCWHVSTQFTERRNN